MKSMRVPKRKPTRPGEVLREDVLPALTMSQGEFAGRRGVSRLTVSRLTVSEILPEKRAVTADMPVRIGKLTNTTPESWLSMQAAVDLWAFEQDPKRYRHITPILRAKILQASTSEVYGDPQVHAQTEDYWWQANPIGIRSCYDEGKRCAENLFFDYHRRHKLRNKVARIFNTYGPRMHPNHGPVVSNFIVQGLSGEPITTYGEGAHSVTVEDIFRRGYTATKTPAQ